MAQMADFFKPQPLALALVWIERMVLRGDVQPEGAVVKDPAKSQEFRVPFRDVDMHGEMFRAAYVTRAEEAVTEFWRRRKSNKDDPFFTIGKVTCTFHSVLKLGDIVQTTVGVSKIGGKSAGFLVRMMRGNEAVAEAEVVLAACDQQTREPLALPEDLRDWLYQFLD